MVGCGAAAAGAEAVAVSLGGEDAFALLSSFSHLVILSMALLSARGDTGMILPSFPPSGSCPHLRVARSNLLISPRPSCCHILAVDSGNTGWTSAVTMRNASAEV